MGYYRDLREYLAALEQAGKLRVVRRQINKDTELHPLVKWQFRGLEEADRTGFLFENLTDLAGRAYEGKVATSILAPSREVYALGLQCGPGEIWERWQQAYRAPIEPRLVASGPVKEVIHKGQCLLEHGGLGEFPIPMATNGWEALPRMTALLWHTRDSETGVINVGTYNGTPLGPSRTSCRLQHGAQARHHVQKARHAGVTLQAAVVIGAVPAVAMASGTKVPYGLSELAVAGGLAGEPVEVVRCETVDLVVPATAEIVLEGEILPDEVELDAPSGEHTGYMIVGADVFVFHIQCITHRRHPIWHDFISQMPPSESSTLRSVGSEGTLLSFLRKDCGIPQVKNVAFHHSGGAWRLCVIQMQDMGGVRTHNATVWQTLFASLSKSPDWPKIVIAVDEDIDPHDAESVNWALSFRFQPHRDLRVVQGRSAILDQSAMPHSIATSYTAHYPESSVSPQGASAMLLDATRKWAYTPVSLPKKEYMDRARAIWEELGLPALKPRVPWHGYDLGVWPEEFRELAELGEKGEFGAVAQRLKDWKKPSAKE
ncbi:MAG: UbiD family decarboxylase [Acidobacteria bacterium]|nr:UbiD family decarboxylase [Acidobacteriota bacterium]